MDRLGKVMQQILDYFFEPAYAQICVSDQDGDLGGMTAIKERRVFVNESAVAVAVTDEEPESQVEVEVYLGPGELPSLQNFEQAFDGRICLKSPGLLVFAPTGDEVLLDEVEEGFHQLAIFRDGYPTHRLVMVLDADERAIGQGGGTSLPK
jgi:hypothetical protein